MVKYLIVDALCGAGGTSTGFKLAKNGICKVIACLNHDEKAIASHKLNYPDVVHFQDDIYQVDWSRIKKVVREQKKLHPDALVILWASIDCTEHSIAKGGKPKDNDARMMAFELFKAIECIFFDIIQIENVKEFRWWGPLDKNKKPIKKLRGTYFQEFRKGIMDYGYHEENRLLNSADWGAYTSRLRFFQMFVRRDIKLDRPVFPLPTHAQKPHSLFDKQKPWKPVKEVLDLNDEGNSFFGKKYSEKTAARLLAGLYKFVAKGDKSFIQHYYSSSNPYDKVSSINEICATLTTVPHQGVVFIQNYNGGSDKSRVHDLEKPVGAVLTSNRHSIVKPIFVLKHNGNNIKTGINNGTSIDKPFTTLTTQVRENLVNAEFIMRYNKDHDDGSTNCLSPENPAPTVLTNDTLQIVFIDKDYGNKYNIQHTERPYGALTTNCKGRIVKLNHILKTGFNADFHDTEKPAFALQATQHSKNPPHLVTLEQGETAIAVYESDSETVKEIKFFMAYYGIVDIKLRMLKIPELLRIQGFPEDYKFKGSQEKIKWFIGNSVVPCVVTAWIEAIDDYLTGKSNQFYNYDTNQ